MQMMGRVGQIMSSRGGASAPMATSFNGTSDGAYFNASPPLSGVANGPAFTMSLHFKATKSAAVQYFTDQDIAFFHRIEATGSGLARWLDTADGSPLLNVGMGASMDNGSIHSLVVSGDRTSGRRQIVYDRTTILNDTAYATAVDLDLATEFFYMCRGNGGGTGAEFFGGTAWEFWWDDSTIDVVTNLSLFVNADNTAADKGADGSTPTGSAPAIYAPDGNPVTNLGTAGNATAIGSPTPTARPT